jgi:O-antigen ligase
LVFLLPIFSMTIKGWVNSISILLFLIACFQTLSNPTVFFKSRGKIFWLLFISLLMPFLAELIVQVGRGDIVWNNLDGPSRFFAAAIFFVFLTRTQSDFLRCISSGALAAVFVTSFSVLIFTDQYWGGGRAATYFVDPITLPVYLVAALSLVRPTALTWGSKRDRIMSFSVIGAFVLVCIVAVLSQSRTSWVAFVALLEMMIFFATRENKRIFVLMNLILLASVFLSFQIVDSLQARLSQAFSDIHGYIRGDGDTSIGLRIGLMWMDIKLFFGFPLFGIADGQLPPREWFSARGLEVSATLYQQKLLTGSHSEIFAHLCRKGIFAIPVIFALFLIPIFYFLKSLMSEDMSVRDDAMIAVKFVAVIFLSSLTIQVFNLKWTSTFYAFVLAVIFSQIFRKSTFETP